MDIGTLRQRQSLPLEMKIQKSIRTIEQFYDDNDGNVYISTGGADSSVLRWLSKQSVKTKDIECVCVASTEPPGNIKLNFERGDTLLKSPVTKKKVIIDWGYPIISKEVSMALSRYMRTDSEEVKHKRLNGYMGRNGKIVTMGMIPKIYQFLIYAPFEASEKCCLKTKEGPLLKFNKVSGKLPITGEMAQESRNRQVNYLKNGCIIPGKKCTPLGFWTDQDIKECIRRYDIPISSEYGSVIKLNGELMYSNEKRTGCDVCLNGIVRDPLRIERMKRTKPGTYKLMMYGGHFIRKDRYRWVKFRVNSIPIWSNLYWVPDDKGFGYKFVFNYLFKGLKGGSSGD